MPTLQNLPTVGHRSGHHSGYRAVIFDMDGVVTDTASVHAAAWKALFDEVLSALSTLPQVPFDAGDDYRRYVDGRTREDGIRAFLATRDIELPEGTVSDGSEQLTVNGLALRKQALFERELSHQGVHVFPDAVHLVRELRSENMLIALVTSSRNSAAILDAAGIGGLFDVRVDGTDAVALSLPGKPDPAMFLEAARRLDIDPADAVVVEDATAGVRAGAAGGFGFVVGVDRASNGESLLQAGADVVVADLTALDDFGTRLRSRDSATWCGGAANAEDSWLLGYDRFDPDQEQTREALCTLGNGYWATRGAVLGSVSDGVHYPGTYLAGVYNRLSSAVGGRAVETEHMVNAPNWAFLTVQAEDGPVFRPGSGEMISHSQELDLRRGVLTRTNRYRDAAGRTTRVSSRQFQSQSHPHLAALEITVEAEDWSGDIIVGSGIDGKVANRNVAADSALAHEHLLPVTASESDPETVLLESVTNQSAVTIATASRTRLRDGAGELGRNRRLVDDAGYIGHSITLTLERARPVVIEKVAAVATSRDRAVSTAVLDVQKRIRRAPGFEELLESHLEAWEELWERFGVHLQSGERQSLALNLNVFHVLQTLAHANPDLDAGVPARGLHGEGYRGHIFWDELFVYPTMTLRRPDLTRALLQYRYRRLDEARAAARMAGLAGAMFPWQSGSDGREETPTELFNVRTGQWMPDNSHRQRHVGLAVAYSVWQYYQATGDREFLARYGAEILVEVARLFTSLASYDRAADRFDIAGVMGPDEFHDGYPDAPGQGLRNNAYTNVLASWVLARVGDAVGLLTGHDLDSLRQRLELGVEEPIQWDRVSRRLRVPFHADGIISQFEGYEQLQEFDWSSYRLRYGNIGRLDLILQAEGDSTNKYRLSKQADVLMLFYLLSAEELRAVFDRLGYALPADLIPRTVDFYLSRTSHGSTLSRLAHSWVLARSDRPASWLLFTQALESDLSDTQGGTTREGVHLGAMAGTADMVVRCFGGVETREDALWLHPVLPADLPAASFQLLYREQPISVDITRNHVRLRLHSCSAQPINVCVENMKKTIGPGETLVIALEPPGPDIAPAVPPSVPSVPSVQRKQST
ncbi:beta-phosphoglucomutase family hydrolase [Cryobacterium glaciale]|uniref:Beta-phosphoglucomutase family hydrolase n=1 Tax=Cryobacterium glaciale TaxID=1259145 RepID=A0A4V3I824_9MICO|nr:beta-phosphoglucomutase family hydrolase [Cryobacterium glaciale]TFB71574.1 beta-phosphoglucomutase family hydrolase [Cryobacterium glaciale]